MSTPKPTQKPIAGRRARRATCLLRRSMIAAVTLFTALTATTEAQAYDDPVTVAELNRVNFEFVDQWYRGMGHQLVDVEVVDTGRSPSYSGVWARVPGTVRQLLHGTSADWRSFYTAYGNRRGRFLDVEVGYFDGQKRYSALFLEDGDDYGYALRTTCTDAQFQSYQARYRREGKRLIDFEAYTLPDGSIRYAGVWVSDPNQPMTALYYGLESPDVSDLLRPIHGRVIDFERYYSPTHREHRYAVIFAQVPGGPWALWRNLDLRAFADRERELRNQGQTIIDIESWREGDRTRFAAVWGTAPKSLWTVGGPAAEPARQALPRAIAEAIQGAEGTIADRIGFHAIDVDTRESMGHRDRELFYLASVAKLVPHFRLWRAEQDGELDIDNDTITYTSDEWYVDDRSSPGLSSCRCRPSRCSGSGSDLGNAFNLRRLDRGMMEVSDNAATSMLIEDPTYGLARLDTDLNSWLADMPGVGRGWGPVTSILDVDRDIMWQGQVMSDPFARSVFGAPTAALEPWFRDCSAGDDPFGRLASVPGGIPDIAAAEGHHRMYRQGTNNAEPRAVSGLLDRVMRGLVLDPAHTRDALIPMRAAANRQSHLRNLRDRLGVIVYAKGGAKGRSYPHRTRSEAVVMVSADPADGDRTITFGVYAEGVRDPAGFDDLVTELGELTAAEWMPDRVP